MATATRRHWTWTERAGFALALCLPASAGAALVLHAVRAAEVPTHADWRAAASSVRASWQDGDLIAFLPGWAQEGRGDFAGLRAMPQVKWDEETVAPARRVIVIASFDTALPAWLRASGATGAAGAAEGGAAQERFGKLRVYRIPRASTAPVYDFTSRLGDARVELQWSGRPAETCTATGARHDCTQQGKLPWRYVGEHEVLAGGRSQRCTWAHPTTGAALRIHYPAATLGQRLRFGHGLSDGVAGRTGAPVTVEVLVGTERVGTFTRTAAPGWSREELSTSAYAGRTEPVSFVVSTPDDGSRHFCFAAEALQ